MLQVNLIIIRYPIQVLCYFFGNLITVYEPLQRISLKRSTHCKFYLQCTKFTTKYVCYYTRNKKGYHA
jgi:hypothetical protein